MKCPLHLVGRYELRPTMKEGRAWPGARHPSVSRDFDSSCLYETELLQRGHPVIQADFFDNLAVPKTQHRRTGEMHLSPRRRRQRSNQEVPESRTRVSAAAFPTADDIVTLGDQVRSAPEIEIRESHSKV